MEFRTKNIVFVLLFLVAMLRLTYCVDIITTIAGSGTQGYSGDNGPATSAGFYGLEDVRVDVAGELLTFNALPSLTHSPR